MTPEDSILRWWPLLLAGISFVGYIVRVEMLAKRNSEMQEEFESAMFDKLTNYATTADLSEVRGQVLVALSQLNDLKPTLMRLENKIDTVLIARRQEGRHDDRS